MNQTEFCALIAKHLAVPVEQVTLDSHLVDDLDADSLDTLDICHAIEDHCQQRIQPQDLTDINTVGDLYAMLAA